MKMLLLAAMLSQAPQAPLPQPAPIDWEESTELDPVRTTPRVVQRSQVKIIPRAAVATDLALETALRPINLPIGITLSAGKLTIEGTTGGDFCNVTYDENDVKIELNGGVKKYPKLGITKLSFSGGSGNDTFLNGTSIPGEVLGGPGDDFLVGGSGNDTIVGGADDDKVFGQGGNDVLMGGSGTDTLWGGIGDDDLTGQAGNDTLNGDAGRDTLNGGSGSDTLNGGDGSDTLVSVGMGIDTLTGGPSNDNFWRDTNDTITDATSTEIVDGWVHIIGGFRTVKLNGGTPVPVGLEPLGEDLPDPAPRFKHLGQITKQNFDDNPLFGWAGPRNTDVDQGGVGDCYFVARLAAFADQDPDYIRRAIAPLGDGSFAVRLVRMGIPDYVRVDADLWMNSDGAPTYANFGSDGSLWAAMIEKAFAIARRDLGNYESIGGGNGDTFSTLPYTNTQVTVPDFITQLQEHFWFTTGQPAGFIKTTIPLSNKALLLWIDQQLDAGHPMITGAKSDISNATPITIGEDHTWRRGQHVYMIDHVIFDASGEPTGLSLYDPHGVVRNITDPVRLHYCIGRATRLNI